MDANMHQHNIANRLNTTWIDSTLFVHLSSSPMCVCVCVLRISLRLILTNWPEGEVRIRKLSKTEKENAEKRRASTHIRI